MPNRAGQSNQGVSSWFKHLISNFEERQSKPWVAVSVVCLSLAINACLFMFDFDYLEALFYDARVRLTSTVVSSLPSSFLANRSDLKNSRRTTGDSKADLNTDLINIRHPARLISINQKTVEALGHSPTAIEHAQFLEKISTQNPAAIVYTILPNEIAGTKADKILLARAMHATPGFVFAVNDVAQKGEESVLKLLPPFDRLKVAGAPVTSDKNIFARDDVTRRMLVSYQGQPTLQHELAARVNPDIKNESSIRGLFDYLGSSQVYVSFLPTGTYPQTEFLRAKTLDGAENTFENKIVFVGRDDQSTSKDYIRTPYSRDIVAMTQLEAQANMLETLILNNAPIKTARWFDMIVTALISLVAVYVVLALKPTVGLMILGSLIVIYALFAFLLLSVFGIWLGMAHPFLSVFVSYYFFIPYRLISENRRGWEYFQRNRLLTQVEELKTNFLSMMSHDLKTPIARIQGMADVVLNDTHSNLTSTQAEAMKTLRTSTEELLEFVSSILNLSRIESKEVKLHFQSKDPNTLVHDVIAQHRDSALAHGIKIATELEPMFSVKMDSDLIKQVFSNLIENAIKYSPNNSKILVTSEERDGVVVVQVADQGQGIPHDELERVFMKFYRSKNAKSSAIKGSGLGLYLAQYFVQLHSGNISVDSRLGQGSTFTVELPINGQGVGAISPTAETKKLNTVLKDSFFDIDNNDINGIRSERGI
jgi:signal transduction histidine kinase